MSPNFLLQLWSKCRTMMDDASGILSETAQRRSSGTSHFSLQASKQKAKHHQHMMGLCDRQR